MKNRVRTEQGSAYSTRSRFFYMKFILDFTKDRQCCSRGALWNSPVSGYPSGWACKQARSVPY